MAGADKSQPRLAATVVVVRDAPGGLEVLLLQRADKGDHNSLAWVFPGGLTDVADRQAHAYCTGLDDGQASTLLGVDSGGLDHLVAAIRETFEEAGLLFAVGANGQAVDMQGPTGLQLAACRDSLCRGEISLADLCREFSLQLQADSLHYIAHWLTPLGRPKRFDTRFFLAVLPAGQVPAADAVETLQQVWLRPAEALSAGNTRRLMTPTRAVIEQLGAFDDTQALLAWARAPRDVLRVLPRLAMGRDGQAPVLPSHPAWDEVGRLDPNGTGQAWSALRPGVAVVVAMSPAVLRFTSADGQANSYLVDCGAAGWAVVDPGQGGDVQAEALIGVLLDAQVGVLTGVPAGVPAEELTGVLTGAAGRFIRWIGLTEDSPAQAATVAALQARTGAQLLGLEQQLAAPALRAVFGSAPGQLNFLLAAEGLLFSGPCSPAPAALQDHGVTWLAPRQGFLRPASAVVQGSHTPP